MKRKNRYIGYILTFIIVQTISGCGSYAKNNQDITIFNSTDTTVLTRNNNSEILNYETNTIIETSETLLETPMYALYDYNITELCKALVNKNKEIINQYMFFNDGNIQFIDNINFESYKILSGKDSCLYEEYGRKDIFSEYLVSFYISSSNDARFPVGESKWKICFTSGLNAFCYYFIPEDSEINSLLYKKYEKNYDSGSGLLYVYRNSPRWSASYSRRVCRALVSLSLCDRPLCGSRLQAAAGQTAASSV